VAGLQGDIIKYLCVEFRFSSNILNTYKIWYIYILNSIYTTRRASFICGSRWPNSTNFTLVYLYILHSALKLELLHCSYCSPSTNWQQQNMSKTGCWVVIFVENLQ
jgi:hypothetical protein